MAHEVEFRTVEARPLAVVRFTCPAEEVGAKIGAAFGDVVGYLSRLGRTPTGPAVGVFRTNSDSFDVAAGFEVAEPIEGDGEVVPLELPAGDVAVTEHDGPYSELPKTYQAMHDEAAARGRSLDDSGAMWEKYYSGPEAKPEQIRTEVYWPLVPQ